MKIRKEFPLVFIILTSLLAFTYYESYPVKQIMDWRATRNTKSAHENIWSEYQTYDHTNGHDPDITLDFLKGKHFWNPQLAIWLEDSCGNHIETLLVTTSTAKGLFYSGRTSTNFMKTDGVKSLENKATRRVDALPYWSHKRNQKYKDGFYTPPPDDPLPDAISGPTPKENFYFRSSPTKIKDLTSFRVMVEVNVAFDENEFYSEYDFLEDSLYHGGTGLLGQPSLIYGTTIRAHDNQRYYVLSLLGHGHHSGANGDLIQETQSITTAKYIVERIVVGVNGKWKRQK